MRALQTLPLLILAAALLPSCGMGGKEDGAVSQTRVDDLDSLKGTISDDAIVMDESTDDAPVEAAPAEAKAAKPAKAEESADPLIVPVVPPPAPETEDKAAAE